MLLSVAVMASLVSVAFGQHMQQQFAEKQPLHQTKEVSSSSGAEPAAAESSNYGSKYRSGGYGGVDPRYFDRGDTPHFGLAGFPFGYERRYYGQNVVYDNSLAGFPLNYYNYQQQNYQQDYNGGGNSYNSYKPSYSKPQYRSAAYTAPHYAHPQSGYAAPEYGAYLGKPLNGNGNGNNYYSLQYGY